MARKFQIGDTVEVVEGDGCDFKKGYRGIVYEIVPYVPYPYYIRRRNGLSCPFTTKELKLIKRKTNNKKK